MHLELQLIFSIDDYKPVLFPSLNQTDIKFVC